MAQAKIDKNSKKVQKTIQFEGKVWDALEAHMRRESISNISVAANDAVKFALFPEYRDDRNADLVKLYHQLSFSLAEHRKKTGRDVMILQEMMLQFMKEFFAHAREIPKAERAAAETQATVRLDRMIEKIILNLPKPKEMSKEN